MKMIVVVALALVAAAAAAPPVDEPIPIVRSSSVQNPDGGYNFDFETGNGIKREETGVLKDALDEDNKPHQVVSVRGAYSFPGEDGKPVVIQYEADELGYRAVGDSIPTVPSRR